MKTSKTVIKNYDLLNNYKNKPLFFKFDIIILIIIVIALITSIVFITNKAEGNYVEIYYKGDMIERHSLNTDKQIVIEKEGYNKIIIENKKVYMQKADCHNQICVNSPSISYENQRIVCAPNRIVIIIKGDEEELDAIIGGGIDAE